MHEPIASDHIAPGFVIEQDWAAYTPEAHTVWRLLLERPMAALEHTGSRLFLEGAARIGLERDRVPDPAEVNSRLGARTGWAAVPVAGFHDVFGHVPLHAHPVFAD